MNQLQKDYAKQLKRDPIAEAEKILGCSYKENDSVTGLALGIIQDINQKQKAHAILSRDTYWCIPIEEYLEVIESIGFVRIYREEFQAEHCGHMTRGANNVYWLASKSILLNFTEFGDGGGINGGSFYYNVKFNPEYDHSVISSGGQKDGVWCGSHDCRVGIRHNIDMLAENGEFQLKWNPDTWLWLLSWKDTLDKNYDYDKINRDIISAFPEDVKKAIGFKL